MPFNKADTHGNHDKEDLIELEGTTLWGEANPHTEKEQAETMQTQPDSITHEAGRNPSGNMALLNL